jgi:alpha-galactosidase
MGIIYCEKDRTFTLQTKETTYQMQVDQYGFLLHLYYGKKAEGCMDYLLTYYDRGFPEIPMMREQTEPIPWTLFHRSFPATETEISAVHH